ncbi:MAG: hypothetical protein PHE84_01090 [bacterium]|nr:hypothetical protein [bacterium]
MGSHDNRRSIKMRRKVSRRKKKAREKKGRTEWMAKQAGKGTSAEAARVVRVRSQGKPEEPGAAPAGEPKV